MLASLLSIFLSFFMPGVFEPTNTCSISVIDSEQSAWDEIGRVTGYNFGVTTGYTAHTFVVYFREAGNTIIYRAKCTDNNGKVTGEYLSVVKNPNYNVSGQRSAKYNYYIDFYGTFYYCYL